MRREEARHIDALARQRNREDDRLRTSVQREATGEGCLLVIAAGILCWVGVILLLGVFLRRWGQS